MSNLEILAAKAAKALPTKSPLRAQITEALKLRADYAERGRKAAASRRKGKKARKPTKH